MTNGFGECSQIKVGIVLMLDIIVGHIRVTKAMHSNIVGQADLFTDFSVRLAGAAADTATKGEIGRSTDVLVFPVNGIVFLRILRKRNDTETQCRCVP